MTTLAHILLSLTAILFGSLTGPFIRPSTVPESGSAIPVATSSVPLADSGSYLVRRVIDGDTLVVSIDGIDATIRLIGLDTPETVDPRRSVQCYGREASARAKELLTGAEVRIETDPTQGPLDKYGRTLAYVFLPDGTLFNEYMIAQGFGHEYTYAFPYRYQARFRDAQATAKSQKRGLWADGACDRSLQERDAVPAVRTVSGAEYLCSGNAYDCSDFPTQASAQEAFELCGGMTNDIHHLDEDRDGRACEILP